VAHWTYLNGAKYYIADRSVRRTYQKRCRGFESDDVRLVVSTRIMWRQQRRWWRWQKTTKRGSMKWYSGTDTRSPTDTLYMIFALHAVGGQWIKRVLPPNYVTRHVPSHGVFILSGWLGLRSRGCGHSAAIICLGKIGKNHATDRIAFRAVRVLLWSNAHFYTSSGIASSNYSRRSVFLWQSIIVSQL